MVQGTRRDPHSRERSRSPLSPTTPAAHRVSYSVRSIPVRALCEHHLLALRRRRARRLRPGRPNRRPEQTGPGRRTRSCSRPQVQERITQQVADRLETRCRPLGRRGDGRGRAHVHDAPRSPRGRCRHRARRPTVECWPTTRDSTWSSSRQQRAEPEDRQGSADVSHRSQSSSSAEGWPAPRPPKPCGTRDSAARSRSSAPRSTCPTSDLHCRRGSSPAAPNGPSSTCTTRLGTPSRPITLRLGVDGHRHRPRRPDR